MWNETKNYEDLDNFWQRKFTLALLTKYNNFLWVSWFLPKLANFLPLPRKLDNPYYHKQHSYVNKNVKLYRYLKVRNSDEKSKLLFNSVKFSYHFLITGSLNAKGGHLITHTKKRLFLEYLNNLLQTNLWFKNYLPRSNSSHE